MAYEVTATRRRPRRFEDLVGQEFVVATLQKSIAAGKIAHAYLFSGPRGCGKTSSARILARALNCQQGLSATPCGECFACQEITRGSSLDVIEIDGASNTSVNDVRQIKDEVQFPPNALRYKIYIIDEVHMLSTSAFNALLKTIEEPPPYVIFIFATTEIHKVPATIKSRCQQFNFRLVSVEQLAEVLGEAAAESGMQADREALFWIAREATGSVRDAYTLFDQIAAFSDGHITWDKIRTKLGLVGVESINRLAEACAGKQSREALLILDEVLSGGVSVEQFIVDLTEYFRNLLLIANGITKEALLGQSPERFSAVVLERWSALHIERSVSMLLQLYRDIRFSIDPRYELELAVSRLAWLSDWVSPIEMKVALEQARTLLTRGAAVSAADSGQKLARPEITARVSGPFSAADSAVPETEPAGVRGEISENSGALQDPFGALRKRWEGSAGPVKPISDAQPGADAQSALTAGGDALKGDGITAEENGAASVAPVPAFAPSEPEPTIAFSGGNSGTAGIVAFADLQNTLVCHFQKTKNMVATSLAQSRSWEEINGSVRIIVDKPFVHNFLEQERNEISSALSRFAGRSLGLTVELDTLRADTDRVEGKKLIPAEVEIVRNIFKGSIVSEESK